MDVFLGLLPDVLMILSLYVQFCNSLADLLTFHSKYAFVKQEKQQRQQELF